MRKENLKRKGEDDAENDSDGGEQENSPPAADKEEDVEMRNANENTEENGDSKEPGTDDDFEDAETGDDKNGKKSESEKEEETGDGKEKEGEANDDEDEDDAPLKKNGRGKPKPAKKGAKETNGDSKANGDDEGEKEEAEGDGEENADDEAGDEKDDAADSDYESGSKKGKKSAAGKRAAPKKKDDKKAKPKPAKKTKKEEIEEEDAAEEEEYEVQDIVDHRKEKGGKMVFRIRWKNYGAKDDTWEPESTLSCPEIIKRYKAKLKKEEEKEEEEVEYEVQDIVDHRKERGGKMVYRIRWKNFGAKDDTWEPEATLSCPEIIKRYKAKIQKEEEEKEAEDEEQEEEYEVQDIIDHRKEKGKMVYRIRWKNFGPKDDTWEQESTLSCPEIIKRYKAKIEKEDSAPPAKKAKPGPKGAPAKKGATPKAPPKKRAVKEESEDDDDEGDDDVEYEVEKIIEVHFKRNGQRDYLVRWKGFTAKDDTWEPEEHLHCKDLIAKFNEKLDKSKTAGVKELRVNRKQPERLNLVERGHKTSKRNAGKVRVNYYDGE